jgi:AraC family transcriptional regulator
MRVEALIRMMDALDLMEQKMEQKLDIEEISRAACSSPFHFQRMFHMLTGMTVAEYMRKRKLTLAAQELASSSSKVLDVALKYGYDSPESFSKAFRKLHGISPSDARGSEISLKAFPRITFHLSLKGDKEMDYRIVDKEAFTILGKSFETTCKDGEQTRQIPRFWEECHQNGTIAKLSSVASDGILMGICDMPPGQEYLTYTIASNVHADEQADGFISRTIPALTWAIFTSTGPIPGAIQSVFSRIFQEWFPGTGYEHAGGPEIEVYLPGDVTADTYQCEVWIPVVKK